MKKSYHSIDDAASEAVTDMAMLGFGVAPAVLLYVWTMASLQSLGWAIVLLFTVCCALRLARFNTQIGAELPPYAYNFFTGVPAPAAAGPARTTSPATSCTGTA